MAIEIEIECPSGHRLKVPEKLTGHSIACPVCDARFSVVLDIEEQRQSDQMAPEMVLSEPTEPIEADTELSPETQIDAGQSVLDDMVDVVAPCPASSSERRPDVEELISPLREPLDIPKTETQQVPELDVQTPPPQVSGSEFSAEQLSMFDDIPTDNTPTWIVVDTEPPLRDRVTRKATRHTAPKDYLLAIAAMIVAVICAMPAIFEHASASQFGGSPDAWTYCVLLGCLIQLGIAAFAIMVPDWSTHWIGALTTTGSAAAYAMVLALTMFARQDHELLRELGLPDEVFRNQAQPWCFLIMSLSLILAYFFGRSSARWRHVQRQYGPSGTH